MGTHDQPGAARPRLTRVVVPHPPKPTQLLAAWVVFCIERIVTSSLRCQWNDRSGLAGAENTEPVIFCLWHNRLAISMMVHRRHPRKLAALVSASKDGAFLAAILRTFNVAPVRGSTSRRGAQAMLELTSHAEMGYDLAVTPDGPRGPRYVVQKGVIDLAQITGLPIIPVTCHTHPKIRLKSWDRFQLPLPFSRCELFLNEPIRVRREAGQAEKEKLRAQVQHSLLVDSID